MAKRKPTINIFMNYQLIFNFRSVNSPGYMNMFGMVKL